MIDADISRLTNSIADAGALAARSREPEFQPGQAPGRSQASANPLATVAPAGACFVVSDAAGRRGFTRDGEFTVQDGYLTTRTGAKVLGYARGGNVLGELRLDPVDVALERARSPRIERDGSFGYAHDVVDPHTGRTREERTVEGTLALARFPAGTALIPFGNAERAPLGVTPHYGRPVDGNFGALATARREDGDFHVRIDRALDRLHDAYQQLDALTAAKFAHANGEKTAMDLVK